jgi:hypothetical protein
VTYAGGAPSAGFWYNGRPNRARINVSQFYELSAVNGHSLRFKYKATPNTAPQLVLARLNGIAEDVTRQETDWSSKKRKRPRLFDYQLWACWYRNYGIIGAIRYAASSEEDRIISVFSNLKSAGYDGLLPLGIVSDSVYAVVANIIV